VFFNIPINRIVTFVGPIIAAISTAIATWLIAKVNVLGIPGLDQNNLQTYLAAGLTAILLAGLHALGGWSWLKGHHILLAEGVVTPPDPVPDEADVSGL
jgi:uncharacterized membrane protein YedE/YeeE